MTNPVDIDEKDKTYTIDVDSENTGKVVSTVKHEYCVDKTKNENWLEAAGKKLKKVDEKPKRMKKLYKCENLQLTPGSSGKKCKKRNVGERKLTKFHDIRSLWEKKMKEDENERSSVKCSVKHNLKNILFRNIIPYLDIESEVLKVSSISQNLKLKS